MSKKYIEDDAGDLRAALEQAILGWDGVTTRKMFGCPSFMANGTLFALVVNGGIVLTQLAATEREALTHIATVGPFQAGRKLIHRWAQVTVAHPDHIEPILPYVRYSYQSALMRER